MTPPSASKWAKPRSPVSAADGRRAARDARCQARRGARCERVATLRARHRSRGNPRYQEPELPPPPPPPTPPPPPPPLLELDGSTRALEIDDAIECTSNGAVYVATCSWGMLARRSARSQASASPSATAHALYSRSSPCCQAHSTC